MPYLGVKPADEFTSKDLNGKELILDEDADTTITADTDNQIDIRIAGADDFQFTANTFTAQSGSTIAAQALTATTGVFSSDVTGLTLNATGVTSAGDNAAVGYEEGEGLILTGQGTTNDITIKNDADTAVLEVATGQSDIEITGGNIVFGTASKGVYLGVTSATAANLLNDYEEGTFTATLVAAGGSGTIAYSSQVGRYIKIGSLCYVSIRLITTSIGSRSGNASIAGLPFTANAANSSEAHIGSAGGLAITAGTHVSGHCGNGSATITVYNWDATTGTSILQISEWSADGDAMLNMVYDI